MSGETGGEDQDHSLKFKQLRRSEYHHGYTSQEWSKELEELKVPELLLATPEAILDFKIEWLNYSEAVDNIAAKQHRYIPVKSVFDCIEKHNRIYICGVANLLPRAGAQGARCHFVALGRGPRCPGTLMPPLPR